MNTPRYAAPKLKDLPDDIKTKVLEVQEKAGFVPNVFLAFARRPAEWRAFFAYHDALMVPESVGRTSNLSKGDPEMSVGPMRLTPPLAHLDRVMLPSSRRDTLLIDGEEAGSGPTNSDSIQ